MNQGVESTELTVGQAIRRKKCGCHYSRIMIG